ncbi:YeeE/YedE family protein [Phyllobacterium sp. LjRoot231]|uniref:YeeE/YedE family protein n=1 Tax=Phyllobacterium sp. LjRoot231 TaxID=3342289 RepID=UPI003ED1453E
MHVYLSALAGGMLIGLSATMFLLFNGRVAGISGIVGRLAQGLNTGLNAAFVLGLILGPLLFNALFGRWPVVTVTSSWPLIICAGFLVGFGTRMGSGCTSGHGVLGLARFSRRSIAAVVTFLATGIAAVTILRIAGL